MDVAQNPDLEQLILSYNLLTSLDVSQNQALTFLWCDNNQLSRLNIKNGNNSNFSTYNPSFDATNNPSLTCIQVDNATDANNGVAPYNNWDKDSSSTYSENCLALGVDDEILDQTLNLYPNPVSEILSVESRLPLQSIEIYNLLGQEVKVIDSDFESINTSDLSRGIYMIKISSENGSTVRKLIKQ